MSSTSGTLRRCLLAIVATGIFVHAMPGAARADERCDQLMRLHRQYAGVELTSEQQHMKVQLVAWYKANCRKRHSVSR